MNDDNENPLHRSLSIILFFSSVKAKHPVQVILHDTFLKLHLHHFSKIKINKEDTKQKESRFCLLFLLDNRRVRPVPQPYLLVLMDPDPGGIKTKGS
jgi:hypothetical protein